MIVVLFIFFISTIPVLAQEKTKEQSDFPVLKGSYLGQKPPDKVPVLFPTAGLQADSAWFWHGSPAFSPDLNEMVFTKYVTTKPNNRTEIHFIRYENGRWTAPELAPFANSAYAENNPFFLQSGDTLYFYSSRPGGFIFRTVRTVGVWSEPVPLSLPLPSGSEPGLQFSISRNKTIYAELWENNNTDLNIYRWRLIDGKYSTAEKLGGTINTPKFEMMPLIDSEERFLFFCSKRPGGYGEADLYISFKKDQSTWTDPRNMGSLFNTESDDVWPVISPDGKYFFFCLGGELGFNPFWVDAKIIGELKPKESK